MSTGRRTSPERQDRLAALWRDALIARYTLQNRIEYQHRYISISDLERSELPALIERERRLNRAMRIAQGVPKELA